MVNECFRKDKQHKEVSCSIIHNDEKIGNMLNI